MRRLLACLAVAVSVCCFPLGSVRADAPALAELVPDSVTMHVQVQGTRDRERFMEPYAQAFQKLRESGIGRDIFELVTMDQSPEQKEQAKQMIRGVVQLLRTPNWEELLRREVSVSFRMLTPIPLPEYVVLFRVPPKSAPERVAEFQKVFQSITNFSQGRLALTEEDRDGVHVTRIEIVGVPVAISVASHQGVVVLCTSDGLFNDVLRLLKSEDRAGSLAKSSQFARGLESLGGPSDTQGYFDITRYVGSIGAVMNMAAGAAQNDPGAKGALEIGRIILEEVSRLGTITSIGRTNRHTSLSEMRLAFVQGEREGFFEKLIRDQDPIEEFVRPIPKDAIAFYMTSGLNPATVYDAVTGLVRQHLPWGPYAMEQLAAAQEEVGFNFREDLLSWLDGGAGVILLPGKGGRQCPEHVAFLRLKDEEKARAVLEGGVRKIREFLESRGQQMKVVALPDGEGQFWEVQIASLPWLRPVVGLPGGVAIIASSKSAMQRVSAAYTGEAPNFSKNPAFKALEFPEGHLIEVYYSDIRDSLEGLANLTSGAGFFLSVLPEEYRTRKARKLGAVLTKLAGFLRDVDLGVYTGSWTTYDADQHATMTRMQTRIRPRAKL